VRFKPRYRLATLLTLITATALLLWGVPEWREYQRRMEFERAACQLKAGFEPDLFRVLPRHAYEHSIRTTLFADANHKYVKSMPIFYKRYWYCIYVHHEEASSEDVAKELLKAPDRAAALKIRREGIERWTQVRVYRLAPMPRGYQAQTATGKKQVLRHSDNRKIDRSPQDQYLTDFLETIAGRERRDLGISYELIHSDPPMPDN
jgi:hypothetical protein